VKREGGIRCVGATRLCGRTGVVGLAVGECHLNLPRQTGSGGGG
jgi:hypothetical protein